MNSHFLLAIAIMGSMECRRQMTYQVNHMIYPVTERIDYNVHMSMTLVIIELSASILPRQVETNDVQIQCLGKSYQTNSGCMYVD